MPYVDSILSSEASKAASKILDCPSMERKWMRAQITKPEREKTHHDHTEQWQSGRKGNV